MKDKPFAGCSAVAPLIGVLAIIVIVVLWIRSYRHADIVAFFTPSGKIQVLASVDGDVILFVSTISMGRERALSIRWGADDPVKLEEVSSTFIATAAQSHHRFGFESVNGNAENLTHGLKGSWTFLRFPDSLPTAALVGCVTLAGRRRWICYKRKARGLCEMCGYDLRASCGRCPECGTESSSNRQFTSGSSPPAP